MRPRALLALVASLSLVGCLEEERMITLEPDGRGTLRLVRTAGKEIGATLAHLLEENPEVAATRFAAEQLKGFDGVVAWTDVVASVTSDGRLHLEATGWFEDASRVVEVDLDGGSSPLLVVTREAATWRVAMPLGPSGVRERFDVEEALPLVRRVIGGLRRETVVHLPGDVVEASGWAQEGRTLRKVVDEARLLPALEGLPPGKEGTAELGRRIDDVVRADATVGVPDAGPSETFTERLRAAVAAWETSRWRGAIERARLRAQLGERPRPPAPPDRFEPNDELAAARPLKPGAYGGLVAEVDTEDWYSVRVPAGSELRVSALPGEAGALALALHDERRRVRAGGLRRVGPSRTRLVVEAEQTVYVCVSFGDETPYTLVVDVLPYLPGDAFEPNDDPEHAAALPPGTHEELVLDEEDWYRVEGVEAGRAVEVRVRKTAGELSIEARSGADAPLDGRRLGPHDDRALLRHVVPEEGLLLRVAGAGGARYALEVVDRGPLTDALEPNDAPDQARPLEPGAHEAVLEGEDWYRLELAPGKRLRVGAEVTDEVEGRLSLEAYAPGSTEAPQARSEGLLTIARRRPGPYLVRVKGPSAASYALEVVEEPFAPSDAFEPNDVAEDAAPLVDGVHEARAGDDRDDWYSIQLPPGARLRLSVAASRDLFLSAAIHGVSSGSDSPLPLIVGGLGEGGLAAPGDGLTIEPAAEPRTIRLRVSRSSGVEGTYRIGVVTERP